MYTYYYMGIEYDRTHNIFFMFDSIYNKNI